MQTTLSMYFGHYICMQAAAVNFDVVVKLLHKFEQMYVCTQKICLNCKNRQKDKTQII